MDQGFLAALNQKTEELKAQGLYKEERVIASAQEAKIHLADGQQVLNFCANNYLGLANAAEIIEAAKESYGEFGYGLSSVRFICGTQTIHKQLEDKVSTFLRTEDTILYAACFDANGGLFETLLEPEDAILSDALNHASIIDGVRLCKAKRFRYQHNDMADLEAKLKEAQECRYRVIATDGVFSMDGNVAKLQAICDLADKYQALVMVDDCHATGFMGENGRGTHEYCGVMGRIDIITSTFGKCLGGASGGFTSGRKEIINWLRQRSRPYLFSNTLAPSIAAGSIRAIDLVQHRPELRQKLFDNANYFRERMTALGFELVPGNHPIIPVMLGDAKLAQTFAAKMLEKGIYVIGFCYPVVPQGKARIRTQMSAAHSREDLDRAIEAFASVGHELNILSPVAK
ncbi:MAG: glycine C-acetyltransferase [Chlamydiia bacterium]|nr:glycine C-acetyltransferase [Chlamydiia bacterium]